MEIKSIAAPVLALLFLPAFLYAQDVAEPASAPSPAGSPGKNSQVVEANRLIAMLPQPPAGWTADKADGSTTESDGFQITTVGRTYVKLSSTSGQTADDAPTANINIIDSANNQQFQEATKAMWSATSNTPEGYDKAVKVAGLPGFEHFTIADQTGVLWVIAAGRFFVQVETTKQPATDLEGWLTKVDLKKLSTLK